MIVDNAQSIPQKDVFAINDGQGNSIRLSLANLSVKDLAGVYNKPAAPLPPKTDACRRFLQSLGNGSYIITYKNFLTHGALSGIFTMKKSKVLDVSFGQAVHDLNVAVFRQGNGGLIFVREKDVFLEQTPGGELVDILTGYVVDDKAKWTRLTPSQTRFLNNFDSATENFLQQEIGVVYEGRSNEPDIDCCIDFIAEPPSHGFQDDPRATIPTFASLEIGVPLSTNTKFAAHPKTGGEELIAPSGDSDLDKKVRNLVHKLNALPGRKRLTIVAQPESMNSGCNHGDCLFMSDNFVTNATSAKAIAILEGLFGKLGGTISVRTYTQDKCKATGAGLQLVRMLQVACDTHEIRTLPAAYVRHQQNSQLVGFGPNGPITKSVPPEPGVVMADDKAKIFWHEKQRPPTKAEEEFAMAPFIACREKMAGKS